MPNRRAFLLAGGLFAAGLSIGGACGYAVGAGKEGDADAELAAALRPTGDADLDELRRLAVVAPMAELADKWLPFMDNLLGRYSQDLVLWRGAERLVATAVAGDIPALDGKACRWLVQCIEKLDPRTAPAAALRLQRHLTELKRRR